MAARVSSGDATYDHVPDERGLSRGRNRALSHVREGIVAFPDDDCFYPDDLLKSVAEIFRTGVDGVTVSQRTPQGTDSMLRWKKAEVQVSKFNIPRTVNSSTIFLSADIVRRVGNFAENLGAGAGTKFGAGEENDFILRAIDVGANITYRPDLFVYQADWREELPPEEVLRKAVAYNRGFGHVLRTHRLYGQALYWITRSAAGVAVTLGRPERWRLQWAHLRGRVSGFLSSPKG